MERELTLIEHVSELRSRIIICVAVIGIASAISFSSAAQVLAILKLPAVGIIERLVFFSPQEAFSIYMRIALLSGLIISMPVIFYQLLAFVGPAIEDKFKGYVSTFIFFCTVSFIVGCVFSYFILIPPALKFLLSFAGKELVPIISAEKYVSFVTGLLFGTGIVFQMPVLSFLLTKMGVINAAFLRKKYRYAIVGIFIAAAIITPTTDVFNMLILAGPMLLLYEISIWLSLFAGANTK